MTQDTVTQQYSSFVRSRRALGRSPRTLEGYDLALQQFTEFLTREHGNDNLDNVTRHTIQNFMIEFMGAGRTSTTANKTFRALRAFFNWLEDEEVLTINPFSKKLKAPQVKATQKYGYSIPEVKAIFATLREEFHSGGREQYLAIRDYALCMVLYDTGLRASEIIAMLADGLDEDSAEFQVKGKGDKTYRRHLSTQSILAINRYLEAWNSFHLEPLSGKLWRGWNGSHLTRSGLYRVCSNRAANAGVKNGDIHRWRYTHAEVLDELGWHEDMIMAEMGHSQRSVSRHYRQASIKRQALKLHSERGPTSLLH